jgi:hypothetical protein
LAVGLAATGALKGSRGELQAAASAGVAKLPEAVRPLAADAVKDLQQLLNDIPDSSLTADWKQVCDQMARDLLVGPEKTLAELDSVRRSLLKTGNARLFLIASATNQQHLAGGIDALVSGLDKAPVGRAKYSAARRLEARLRARDPQAVRPVFVGLLNPNSQGGVFVNSAPAASYLDTDRDKLLDYLAGNQYSGQGAHGMFMKTWGAGLAYSNGLRPSPSGGRLLYYAERTPELPQTLRFVIGELKKVQDDPKLAEYALAEAFREIRSAQDYEARGEAMAADLADGFTPEVVVRFQKALLALRSDPNLSRELFRRMPRVYARVLPGLGAPVKEVEDGCFFTIGPEKQFAAYEQYLKTVEGPGAKLYRLYPRDFWLP